MLSHVTTSYCVVTKWMFKILLTHRASVLSHFVAESDSAAVLMSLCPPAKQNKTNANVNGDKNLVFTWGKSHTNHKQFREVVKIRIFYGQSDREGGGFSPLSPGRKQIEPFISIEPWFFDVLSILKTHFTSSLKNAFFMPFSWLQMIVQREPASCKW